ncbi:hypothetical protein FQZ97_252580 [compost metagenome]
MRAAAPASRIGFHRSLMLVEPPVNIIPTSRTPLRVNHTAARLGHPSLSGRNGRLTTTPSMLLYRLSMGDGSTRICDQSASISSASSIAAPVCTPCPISTLLITTVTVLSDATLTQPFSANCPSRTASGSPPTTRWRGGSQAHPITSAAPAPAPPSRKALRVNMTRLADRSSLASPRDADGMAYIRSGSAFVRIRTHRWRYRATPALLPGGRCRGARGSGSLVQRPEPQQASGSASVTYVPALYTACGRGSTQAVRCTWPPPRTSPHRTANFGNGRA